MTAEKAAGGVSEVDQGVVAGRRVLVGHRVAAVDQDSVRHTGLGRVVVGVAG